MKLIQSDGHHIMKEIISLFFQFSMPLEVSLLILDLLKKQSINS